MVKASLKGKSLNLTAVSLASLSHNSGLLAALLFVVLCLGYVAIYARMVRHHWCSPITFLLFKPSMQLNPQNKWPL